MPYLAKQQVSWPLLPPSGQSNTRPTYNILQAGSFWGGKNSIMTTPATTKPEQYPAHL